MKDRDINESETSFVLCKDGEIVPIKNSKLTKNVRKVLKNLDAELLLIQSGVFTPSYCKVKADSVPKSFGTMKINYTLSITTYRILDMERGATQSDTRHISMNIANYAEFIKFIYSFFKVQTFNRIYNDLNHDVFNTSSGRYFSVDNMEVAYTDPDGEVNVISDVIGNPQVSTILLIMAQALSTSPEKLYSQIKSTLKDDINSHIGINFDKATWTRIYQTYDKKKHKATVLDNYLDPRILQAVKQVNFGTDVFVSSDDIRMLDIFNVGQFTIEGFSSKCDIDTLPFDEPLTINLIDSHPEYFFEIEKAVAALYTTSDYIEYVSNMQYMILTYRTMLDLIKDDEVSDIIAEITLWVDESLVRDREPFVFTMYRSDVDFIEGDAVSEFFIQLSKYYTDNNIL